MENTRKINKVCLVKLQRSGGYAILEIVFYIMLFSILSIAIINSLLVMTKSFRETTIQAQLIEGGNIMEKISREIRKAYGINTISANSIKLNTKNEAGINKTVEFGLQDMNVRFLENDVFTGNLNNQNISVQNLIFTQISTTNGVAIKIILTIRSNYDSQNRDESFYDTVVLRGSY